MKGALKVMCLNKGFLTTSKSIVKFNNLCLVCNITTSKSKVRFNNPCQLAYISTVLSEKSPVVDFLPMYTLLCVTMVVLNINNYPLCDILHDNASLAWLPWWAQTLRLRVASCPGRWWSGCDFPTPFWQRPAMKTIALHDPRVGFVEILCGYSLPITWTWSSRSGNSSRSVDLLVDDGALECWLCGQCESATIYRRVTMGI